MVRGRCQRRDIQVRTKPAFLTFILTVWRASLIKFPIFKTVSREDKLVMVRPWAIDHQIVSILCCHCAIHICQSQDAHPLPSGGRDSGKHQYAIRFPVLTPSWAENLTMSPSG